MIYKVYYQDNMLASTCPRKYKVHVHRSGFGKVSPEKVE